MIQVTLWSFDKKKNSTKVPTSTGYNIGGEMKENFAVTELSITFNFGKLNYAPTYNYMYIPSLRRFYFIINWIYEAGLWTAVCAVDVLATYKTEIGNSYQYVSRANSNYDPNLVDTTYITTPDGILRQSASILPANFFGGDIASNQGTIVCGVVGASSGNIGAVTYYAMSFSTFSYFMSNMLSSISWANISATEISEELQKALINPTQYIVSCQWFPVVFSSLSTGFSTTQLKLGWWTFTLYGTARILNTVGSAWVTRTQELTIPKHPQISNPRCSYLQCAPYSSYYLKFLPFGVFEIDSTELYDMAYLGLDVSFNLMTGDGVLHVAAKPYTGVYNFENAFLVAEGKVGVTIPVGQISADVGNFKQALSLGVATGVAQLIDGGGI